MKLKVNKGSSLLSKKNKLRLVWDVFAVALGFVAYHVFNACKCTGQGVAVGEQNAEYKEFGRSDINQSSNSYIDEKEECFTCSDEQTLIR